MSSAMPAPQSPDAIGTGEAQVRLRVAALRGKLGTAPESYRLPVTITRTPIRRPASASLGWGELHLQIEMESGTPTLQ